MRKRSYASKPKKVIKRAKINAVPRSLGMPTYSGRAKTSKAKVTYSEYFTLNPGVAGACASYVFSANGLYDPNITGGGHQPGGFDQYMALYTKYFVKNANIKVYFWNTDTTSPQMVGIMPTALAATSTDVRVYYDQGQAKIKQIGQQASGTDVVNLSYSLNNSAFPSIKASNDDTFSGTASANPTDQNYFIVFAAAFDQATDTATINCQAIITYDVEFRDPAIVPIS